MKNMLRLYFVVISAALALSVNAISESASIPSKSKSSQIMKRYDYYPTRKQLQRQPSFLQYHDFAVDVDLWTEPSFPFVYHPESNSIQFNSEPNRYITPDFSNGLDYPDPLLLRGLAASRAVQYLYSRELFFTDIPHIRAILRNQGERTVNGLAGNRLGSLRPASPFYRFKRELQRVL